MNKKKIAVLALLMIVVVALTSCMLVACNPDNSSDPAETKPIEATKGLLINNSDFKVIDTSVTTYPRSVTSWTGAKMYSSGTFRDDVTAGVISLDNALYNANKSKWNDNDNVIYNKLTAGGRFGDGDDIKNTLMIYMPEESTNADGNKINGPTAYGYTSTSFSLDKGSYYKLSVDVLTHNIGGENEGERGARIYVSSNTYAEFSGIDTNGEWKTYTVFVETSPAASTSLTLMLGLGKYNSYYTKGLTSGYAFFDNVKLEKLATDDDKTPEDQFNDAKNLEKVAANNVATATLKVPNGRFDFGSSTLSSSGTPNNWALVTGNSGKEDPAPTSLGYNAVIDLAKFDTEYSKYSSTFNVRDSEDGGNQEYVPATRLQDIVSGIKSFEGRVGTNAFMLSQQLMTAQGIRSSRTITIEKNKIYALSVDLYTYGIHGAGVSLILTGSDGKDIIIKGISSQKENGYYYIGSNRITPETGITSGSRDGNSTDGWRTYTFYIQGNQFKDFSYNMTIWLGTDGTNDNHSAKYHSFTSGADATTYDANGTFSNGWVFIDELTLTERTALPLEDDTIVKGENQTLDCEGVANDVRRGLIVDLTSTNLFGEGDDYILSSAKATNAPTLDADGVDIAVVGGGSPAGWTSSFDPSKASNPIISGAITEGIVNLSSEDVYNGPANTYPGLPYDIINKNAYMMHSSTESYYEVETEPFTVGANRFYRISVWIKTVDVSSSSGAYVYLVDKSGDDDAVLTSFTKINTKDLDEYLNDWCELSIVVRGAADKSTDVALKFTLGTGNRWAYSTLTHGALFVTNMNRSEITYANFNDTTSGTYVKSVDLSESFKYTFTNGNFDDYDLDDENLEENKPLSQQTVPGKPDDFTISDNTVNVNTDKDENALFAGVIALEPDDSELDFKSTLQATTVTGINESVFNNFYGNDGTYGKDYIDSLAGPNVLAIGSRDANKKYAIGYSSTSVTLSANKFYQLSVYAKTVGDTKASIFLSGESSASTGANFFFIEENNTNGKWTKYTFFIEVGNASVSVKLNLWLGRSVDFVADSEVENFNQLTDDEKKSAKEELAKASGVVFFDNVVYKEIEENVYSEATAGDANKKISFLTDSFDTLSTTIESRSKLTSPNGWTGAAGTNQSSSNSKVGVVYADDSYYDTEAVDQVLYSRLLGLEYKLDDITVTDEELAEAGATDDNRDELIEQIKERKFKEQKQNNWIPVNELVAHSGNRMLVINNTANSAYTYTSSSNTLKASSFYEISVWVRTYGLDGREGDDTIGANIELYLGSANESDNPLIFEQIKTQKTEDGVTTNEWKEYKFYVATQGDDVTSVTVKLSLGSYDSKDVDGENVISGLTKGYALFDDVTIRTIGEDEYATADDTLANVKKRTVSEETPGDPKDPEKPGTETPSTKFNLDYLWWMIPTIVIGLVIIVVVIVFVVRKLRKPGAKKAAKVEKAPQNVEVLDKKHSRYDDNKE